MRFAASQDAFAEALLHAERPPPGGLTTARGEPDALRFAVYRNNVYVGLTRALARRFPVTEQLVGPEFFQAMARVYAQDNKPRSPLLFAYGDEFPDFIARFGPASRLAYLPDVARLEAAATRAYHAADAAPLAAHELGSFAPDALLELRFQAHPAARLVVSSHPVGSIWFAHQDPLHSVPAMRGAQTVLVARPAWEVRVHILPPQDGVFAALILAGLDLGDAAERALEADPRFDLGSALVGLVSLGAFAGVMLDKGSF